MARCTTRLASCLKDIKPFWWSMLYQGEEWRVDHILIWSNYTTNSRTKDFWSSLFLPISLVIRSRAMKMKFKSFAILSTCSSLSLKNVWWTDQTPIHCSPTWEKTVLSITQKLVWLTKSSGVGVSFSSTPKVTSSDTTNLSSSLERPVKTSSAYLILLKND